LVLAGDSGYFAAFSRYTGQQHWVWPQDPLARMGPFRTGQSSVGNGIVLAGSAYDEKGVLGLEVNTGKLSWTCGSRKHTRFGNAVFTDDCFYFFGPQELTCIEAVTGSVKWRVDCDKWSFPKPLVTNEIVFGATSRGSLLAVDKQTGQQLWKTTFEPSLLPLVCNSPELLGQLAAPVIYHEHILQACSDGNLYAVNAKTGIIEWKHEFKIPLTSTPVVHEEHIFIVTPDATLWKFRLL
jgi:outer membrane protein assembly factor BamB